jgi:uncharacterized glyoxalase superfamily protein PhnB
MESIRISGGADRRPLKPLPEDAQRVTPYLVIKGAAKALAFYQEAFGAKEVEREELPDGRLLHGSVRVGDSLIMMSDEFPGSDAHNPGDLGTSTVVLHIYSDDVDALWERAVAAGGKPVTPLEDQFWGERYGKLVDPFGHHWTMSTPVEMSEEESEALRQQAFAAFGSGEHPGPSGE